MIQRVINKYNSSDSIRSGFWVLLGLFSSQFIRLASNLVLTRLLLPEYFGMMAILNSMMGLFQMVLDIGLVPSVVNTKRHDDPQFMRTAWTIQMVRSLIIGTVVIIAAYPISIVYSEPQLFPLIIVAGLTVMLSGLKSTALILYQKFLNQKPLILMQISTQIISTLFMIGFAFYFQSVWALLAGYVIGEMLNVLFSYLFFGPHHSRFCWDKDAVREIIGFGRWVFVASIFGYISTRSDVAIMGFWLSMDDLGKYSIAAIFAGMVVMVANNLSVKVLHPHFKRSIEQSAGLARVYTLRMQLSLGFSVLCCVLAVFGDKMIRLMYDERYWEAGWMLQILALGKIGTLLTSTLRPVLLAKGDSFGVMLQQMVYSVVLVCGIFAGATWRGAEGIIIVYAMIPILCHPIMIVVARRHNFHCARADALVVSAVIALVFVAWILMDASVVDVLNAAAHNRPVI